MTTSSNASTTRFRDSEFRLAVLQIVAPVLCHLGFAVVAADDREVRFESDGLSALVFHEERSEQIGFHFDRLGCPDEDGPYSVSHAIRLVDPVAAARTLDPSARTPGEVRRALELLKRDIGTYCAQALCGDAEVFAAMKRGRDLYSTQYGEWTRRSKKMGRAIAIDRGDWSRVVEIYESAEHVLGRLDQRSLEAARQNMRTLRACDPALRNDPELIAEMANAYHAFFGYFDGTDEGRQCMELAVGEAMDVRDWGRVIELYESAPFELEYLQHRRLVIARRQLGAIDEQ